MQESMIKLCFVIRERKQPCQSKQPSAAGIFKIKNHSKIMNVLNKRMKKEILSDFHQLIVDRFGYLEAKYLHLEMDLPPHPVTKAYKSPEKTPHKVLIAFSKILNMHPHELIKDYQVGILRISDIEKDYHQRGYQDLGQP